MSFTENVPYAILHQFRYFLRIPWSLMLPTSKLTPELSAAISRKVSHCKRDKKKGLLRLRGHLIHFAPSSKSLKCIHSRLSKPFRIISRLGMNCLWSFVFAYYANGIDVNQINGKVKLTLGVFALIS